MKTRKHLFKGSIYHEGDLFVARDDRDRYLTYGKNLEHCQRCLLAYLKEEFPYTPFDLEFRKMISGWNFSAYKRSRAQKQSINVSLLSCPSTA